MGKQPPPPGPDYDRLIDLSEEMMLQNKELFDQYMEFQGEQFSWTKELSQAVIDVMLPAMQAEADFASRERQRYEELALPFEQEYMERLRSYDDPANTEQRVGQAVHDVAMATEAAREAEIRRLESYGIDPSQVRSAALDSRLNTQAALAKATAANEERARSEAMGLALGGEAVNLGRGIPLQVAQAYQTAAGMGGQAQSGSLAASQLHNQNYATASSILGQGANILQGGYGTANQIYGNQLQSWDMQQRHSPLAGFGSILGAVLPLFEEGGVVPEPGGGGMVPEAASPSMGAIPDDTLAALTGGEFVLDRDTVQWHGLKTIKKMQEDAKKGLPEVQPEMGTMSDVVARRHAAPPAQAAMPQAPQQPRPALFQRSGALPMGG